MASQNRTSSARPIYDCSATPAWKTSRVSYNGHGSEIVETGFNPETRPLFRFLIPARANAMGAICCRHRRFYDDDDSLDDEELGPYIPKKTVPDRDFLAKIASAVMSATTGLCHHDAKPDVSGPLLEQFWKTYIALYQPDDHDVSTHYYLYAAAIVNHFDSKVEYVHRRAVDTRDGYRKPFADAKRTINEV